MLQVWWWLLICSVVKCGRKSDRRSWKQGGWVSSSAVPRSLFTCFTRHKAEPLSQCQDRDIPFDDEALMARVQTGDMEALGVLFDRYSRLVFGVAARILRDCSEA